MMRRGKVVIGVAAVLSGLLAGCGGGGDRPGQAGQVTTTAPAPRPLPTAAQIWDDAEGWVPFAAVPKAAPTKRWSVPVPAGAKTEIGAGGVVLVGVAGRLERLDLATGGRMWTVPLPAGDPDLTVAGATRPVVVATVRADRQTRSVVLDADDGRTLWSGSVDPGVDATGDVVLVNAGNQTVLIDRATARERWRIPQTVHVHDGTLVFEEPGSIESQTTTDGVVDPATGRVLWQVTDPLFTDVGAVDGLVVRTIDVEPGEDTATAFDAVTGAQRWTKQVPDIGRGSVARLTDDTVLISGGGGPGLASTAVRAADGTTIWRVDEPLSTVLRLDGDPIAFRYDRYRLTVADGRTGDVREGSTPGFAELAGGAVYSPDGPDVVAIGMGDLSEHWRAPGVGYVYGMDAVPGGFAAVVGESEPRTLTAYLG